MRFLPFGFIFDWPEFLLGLLLGILITRLTKNALPSLKSFPEKLQRQFNTVPLPELSTEINPYRDQLTAYLDHLHAAAPLFDLREILIPPRILLPPPIADPDREEDSATSILAVLPTLADWNPLSAVFHAPSIPFGKLVGKDADFLITGEPGSGRSTALAYLAYHLLTPSKETSENKPPLPVLIHASNLDLQLAEKDPLKAVLDAARRNGAFNNFRKISSLISRQIHRSRAILLLDGLDEIPLYQRPGIETFIHHFRSECPGVQIIAAGEPGQLNLFRSAGLVPAPIATWTSLDCSLFTRNWGRAWRQNIAPRLPRRLNDIDSTLINAWLQPGLAGLTPLESTLRIWSAYAGDLRSNALSDMFQAYLNRMLSPPEQKSAEQAAITWIEQFLSGPKSVPEANRDMLAELIDAGICRTGSTSRRIMFLCPAVGAFLAAKAFSGSGVPPRIVQSSSGIGEALLRSYASLVDAGDAVRSRLQNEDPVSQKMILSCARWLRDASPGSTWKSAVLAGLAQILSREEYAYGLRVRALSALVHAGEKNASQLFQHMLTRPNPHTRILAALGLGGIRHEEAVTDLIMTIRNDQNVQVRQACTLALSALGNDRALETLGRLLLQGNEQAQSLAASALLCNIDEGHQMLRDALEMKKAGVRRAAVLGLEYVHTSWVDSHLEGLKLEDDEWVVRNAALEVSERRQNPPLYFVPEAASLDQLPWLISFAAEHGLGVPTGPGGLEILRRAINTGSPEQSTAALEAVSWYADDDFLPELKQAMAGNDPYRKAAAFESYWKISMQNDQTPISTSESSTAH